MICSDDCDLVHCPRCGQHSFSSPGQLCEECQLEDIYEQTSHQTALFGGNYERAAEHFGW
jgi:hypothetical protein